MYRDNKLLAKVMQEVGRCRRSRAHFLFGVALCMPKNRKEKSLGAVKRIYVYLCIVGI